MAKVVFSNKESVAAPDRISLKKLESIINHFRAHKRATLSELSRLYNCNASLYIDVLCQAQNRNVAIRQISKAPAVYEWQGEV